MLSFLLLVKICGQSTKFYSIESKDLLSNVEIALSAITAHVFLQ